ncbi:MAG TPA: hypothetical protein VHB25_01035 [Gemmatimonadaceae bacterium]|nr:hypothetical protein [Gemmatimonadaceae bacterium]
MQLPDFVHRVVARRVALATTVLGIGAIAACSSDTTAAHPSTQSQLSFTTNKGVVAASAATIPDTAGGHVLNLTQVGLNVSRAELKRTQTDTACKGDEDDDHGQRDTVHVDQSCAPVTIHNQTINLPLDTNIVTIAADTIPPGTYRMLEVRVASVDLAGTYDGNAFSVNVPVNARDNIVFASPLVVTAGEPVNITINVPVSKFLVNRDGSLIDPNQLKFSPQLLATVQRNIASSLRAFGDRDHDGRDDHDEHGGHGGD